MTKVQMGIQNNATKALRFLNMNVGKVSLVVPQLQIHITFVVRHWQLKSKFANNGKVV